MALLLCRQRAKLPFLHDKLNLNIWSGQELAYVIYNYSVLCMGDFLSEQLFYWIENALNLIELSSALRSQKAKKEPDNSLLLMILKACNYYTSSEIMSFNQKMLKIAKYSEWELAYLEGKTLFEAGVLRQAFKRINDAVRLQEAEFRKSEPKDDAKLREYNKKKAQMYCDMASLKIQLFDEKSALKILELSENTYKTSRAAKMRYLIDGSGDISLDEAKELDKLKEESLKNFRESPEYKSLLSFFNEDENEIFNEAKKIVSRWKKEYRKM